MIAWSKRNDVGLLPILLILFTPIWLGLVIFWVISAGISINFTLVGDLLVTHEPTQLILDGRQEVQTSITSTIILAPLCQATCFFEIVGQNNSQIEWIAEQTQSFSHPIMLDSSPVLKSLSVYQAQTTCTVIPSTFCSADSTRTTTTPLYVTSTLTPEETQQEQTQFAQLSDQKLRLSQALSQLAYVSDVIDLLPQRVSERQLLAQDLLLQDVSLDSTVDAYEISRMSFATQNYDVVLPSFTQPSTLFNDSVRVLEGWNMLAAYNLSAYQNLIGYVATYPTSVFVDAQLRDAVNYITSFAQAQFFYVEEQLPLFSKVVSTMRASSYDLLVGDMFAIQAYYGGTATPTNSAEEFCVILNDISSQVDASNAQINQSISLFPNASTLLPLLYNQADYELFAAVNFSVFSTWQRNDSRLALNELLTELESLTNQSIPLPQSRFIFHVAQQYCADPQNTTVILPNLEPLRLPSATFFDLPSPTIPDPVCCNGDNCSSCGQQATPVLFIHGHQFNQANTPDQSMRSFSVMQKALEPHFLDAGELREANFSLPFYPNTPLSFRSSYYFIAHYDVIGYDVSVQQTERIENYALRLRDIVEGVKQVTGSDKVHIVAHSMGGLVVRQYVDFFGSSSLGQVITINTPHQGIVGRIQQACGLIGSTKECEDMQQGSVFFSRLSDEAPANFTVIASRGCPMQVGDNVVDGDGIVTYENAQLPGAPTFTIDSVCVDALQTSLHTQILQPDIFPEVIDIILDTLQP